jgi:hypothetical protein
MPNETSKQRPIKFAELVELARRLHEHTRPLARPGSGRTRAALEFATAAVEAERAYDFGGARFELWPSFHEVRYTESPHTAIWVASGRYCSHCSSEQWSRDAFTSTDPELKRLFMRMSELRGTAEKWMRGEIDAMPPSTTSPARARVVTVTGSVTVSGSLTVQIPTP